MITNEEASNLIRVAGKETLDMIQSFVDPGKTSGKIDEAREAAIALWKLQSFIKFVEPRNIAANVVIGMMNDVADDYFPVIITQQKQGE